MSDFIEQVNFRLAGWLSLEKPHYKNNDELLKGALQRAGQSISLFGALLTLTGEELTALNDSIAQLDTMASTAPQAAKYKDNRDFFHYFYAVTALKNGAHDEARLHRRQCQNALKHQNFSALLQQLDDMLSTATTYTAPTPGENMEVDVVAFTPAAGALTPGGESAIVDVGGTPAPGPIAPLDEDDTGQGVTLVDDYSSSASSRNEFVALQPPAPPRPPSSLAEVALSQNYESADKLLTRWIDLTKNSCKSYDELWTSTITCCFFDKARVDNIYLYKALLALTEKELTLLEPKVKTLLQMAGRKSRGSNEYKNAFSHFFFGLLACKKKEKTKAAACLENLIDVPATSYRKKDWNKARSTLAKMIEAIKNENSSVDEEGEAPQEGVVVSPMKKKGKRSVAGSRTTDTLERVLSRLREELCDYLEDGELVAFELFTATYEREKPVFTTLIQALPFTEAVSEELSAIIRSAQARYQKTDQKNGVIAAAIAFLGVLMWVHPLKNTAQNSELQKEAIKKCHAIADGNEALSDEDEALKPFYKALYERGMILIANTTTTTTTTFSCSAPLRVPHSAVHAAVHAQTCRAIQGNFEGAQCKSTQYADRSLGCV